MPHPRELEALFLPLSAGRQALRRGHALLGRYTPAPPRYAYWHLARFVKTLAQLRKLVRPGDQWLDLSSSPWFCLLARAEVGMAPVPTSLEREPMTLTTPDGPQYHYDPLPLEIGEQVTSYPVGNNFDLVTAFELLEHLPFHPAPFLTAVRDTLRPGGRLVLTTPNITSWTAINRLLDGDAPYQTPHFAGPMSHVKEYAPFELVEVLQEAGFRIDAVYTFDCYPSDRRGWRAALLYGAALCWHAAVLLPGRVRHLLSGSGSTQLVVATKPDTRRP